MPSLSSAETNFLRAFVSSRWWTFARTMPDNPHWYTVREWAPEQEDEFEAFVRLLRKHGSDEVFCGRPYRYLDFDGFHYWTMGAPVEATTVINRKPLEA
jgi:hypothetical protein